MVGQKEVHYVDVLNQDVSTKDDGFHPFLRGAQTPIHSSYEVLISFPTAQVGETPSAHHRAKAGLQHCTANGHKASVIPNSFLEKPTPEQTSFLPFAPIPCQPSALHPQHTTQQLTWGQRETCLTEDSDI